MALFDDSEEPILPPPPPTVSPRIEPELFRGITIDTSYVPSSALLTWVEGSNWTVEYFSQVLGADNEPTPLALERDPIYQQYRRIKNMELKVTTPLSFSQDPTTKTMEAKGSGITYPFLVPNKGDMFMAGIGDGRMGLFTLTETHRATILRDSVYTVEFALVTELTNELLADLERKTIETYHYSHASLVGGCGPFVTEQAKARSERYQEEYEELVRRYMTDFFSHEHSTLLVPDQFKRCYDHFVVKALLQILDHRLDPRIRRVREMNVSAATVMSQPTLWEALVRLEDSYLYGATQRISVVSTNLFKGRVELQALGYTGIERLIYPQEPATDVDRQRDSHSHPVGVPLREGRPRREMGPYVPQAERNARYFQPTPLLEGVADWRRPPDIHPVVKDEYYVFTEAFYQERGEEQSKLEILAWQLLKREALSLEMLDSLLEQARDWDNLERFYYYPVLFILLKRSGAR